VIDGLEKGRIFDLRANLFEPIARRCAESLFGFPVATNNLQLDLFFDRDMMSEARDFVSSIIISRTKLTEDSYVGTLDAARRNGQINESELIMNLVVFATATFSAVRAAFLGGVFASVINQYTSHCLGRDGKKVRSILPTRISLIDQL